MNTLVPEDRRTCVEAWKRVHRDVLCPPTPSIGGAECCGTTKRRSEDRGHNVRHLLLYSASFKQQLSGMACLRGTELKACEREIATTTKELKREVAELEQRVGTVERSHGAQAEELDHHRQELLTLQESNHELQYRLEDLKNSLWRSNIRIREVPMQATPGPLEVFVTCLFRHVVPELKDQEIVLDCTHGVG
ncbi:hypothetical protein NDU88_004313 [Pleurodeles waltl]|uniref:Uncharacterized protein n=1 Tax=Pleurodeles waltl TaxID=8319 RepID=A0AAV7PH30_PLEWA|nr:hypothetical protein NDU88_004313 [Pleurodeles waltl]